MRLRNPNTGEVFEFSVTRIAMEGVSSDWVESHGPWQIESDEKEMFVLTEIDKDYSCFDSIDPVRVKLARIIDPSKRR